MIDYPLITTDEIERTISADLLTEAKDYHEVMADEFLAEFAGKLTEPEAKAMREDLLSKFEFLFSGAYSLGREHTIIQFGRYLENSLTSFAEFENLDEICVPKLEQ